MATPAFRRHKTVEIGSVVRNRTPPKTTVVPTTGLTKPGLARNNSAEPHKKNGAGTAAAAALPGLQRNNSIDPSSLGRNSRRMRQPPQSQHQIQQQLNDSGQLTLSSVETHTTSCSFASRWSNSGESVKFGVRNFVDQKEGTLESFYDIGDLIGEGGFGEVYSCFHIETGEERAVKVMEKSTKKPAVNEAIIQEYHILKELDHPNILKVYEMFETKHHFFIVTDLYSGGDLFSVLEDEGCFDEEEAAEFMNALLMCMNYCHKRNLVHLDLKPENVLLTDTKSYSDVKIIDFGLAQYQEASKKITGVEGSSYYMSPQVVNSSYVGSKADVWSCGVICHVMMTGYAPFDGPTYNDILTAITIGEFHFDDPEWDGASETIKDFIRYCLTYDETKRPSAEEALTHPFLTKGRKRIEKADVNRRGSLRNSLVQLEQFTSRHSKLKQATCAIMASQLLGQEEKDEIDDIFRNLDTSHDGALDRNDLKRGYKEYFDKDLSEGELDKLVEQVNFSGSGVIEYSEFAIAILMAQNKIDDAKLKAAYKVFDEDGKGHISADDIKRVLKLGDEQDDYLKKKILRQVDAEETGTINFDDFKKIMHSTTSMMKRKKKKKRLSVKRSPRRALLTSPLAGLDLKGFQTACSLDVSAMDASDISASGRFGYDRRGGHHSGHSRSAPPMDASHLHDLSEYEDEDHTSEREIVEDGDEDTALAADQ